MRWSIRVISSPPLRHKYQRLLSSDWKKSTLDDVLELLWKEMAEPEQRPPFWAILNPHRSSTAGSVFDSEAIEEIRHFRQHFHGNGLIPSVPEKLSSRKASRLRAQAETVWTYLILRNLAHLSGETGFFADTQSLLFLLTIDFLLPSLESDGDAEARAWLINALYMHTFVTWTQDPQRQAHHFFLQAVLMDYLERPKLRRDNYLFSLNMTPVEDHAYLTKVQAYIFSLLDSGEDQEAKRFLMKLYRHAPESYLPELQEMIDNVQSHALAQGK